MQRTMNWITVLIFLYAGLVCAIMKPETHEGITRETTQVKTQSWSEIPTTYPELGPAKSKTLLISTVR